MFRIALIGVIVMAAFATALADIKAGRASQVKAGDATDETEFVRGKYEKKLLDPATPFADFIGIVEKLSVHPKGELTLEKARQAFKGKDDKKWGKAILALCQDDPRKLPAEAIPDAIEGLDSKVFTDPDRECFIKTLGQLGKKAKNALPKLKKIEDGDDIELARAARAARLNIEAAKE